MGWMDRLRAMFGGGEPVEASRGEAGAVEEELAVEGVQRDIERDRDEAVERRIETPTSLED
jgi:hypothetical protein